MSEKENIYMITPGRDAIQALPQIIQAISENGQLNRDICQAAQHMANLLYNGRQSPILTAMAVRIRLNYGGHFASGPELSFVCVSDYQPWAEARKVRQTREPEVRRAIEARGGELIKCMGEIVTAYFTGGYIVEVEVREIVDSAPKSCAIRYCLSGKEGSLLITVGEDEGWYQG